MNIKIKTNPKAFLIAVALFCASNPLTAGPRKTINLNGMWKIAGGGFQHIPAQFTHKVTVPGLVDMATPSFKEVGIKSKLRRAFWYKRTFTVNSKVPTIALLKIYKAKYGTKIFLNGKIAGEHLPCFTPAIIDVKKYLKGSGKKNELVIRVGADRESLPAGMPTGWDFEKYLYIPGIYDSVELVLSGTPFIRNVQTVPDILKKTVRVAAEIVAAGKPCESDLSAQVIETKTSRVTGTAKAETIHFKARQEKTITLEIPIKNCHLWSPEDPFLYELNIKTSGDSVKVRFGMRSFRFDPETKRAVLNGKPYMMRGTNVCILRFFEDAERGTLPWDYGWVRRLHKKFKYMHFNSARYCIGFPPEKWYQIADEEGFLIQDEFPIWTLGGAPDKPKAEKIIPEYIEWMRERWNHPCVVIWDAQNESHTKETGKAIQAVRKLDLSNRPWENGWGEPQARTDCVESHPYLFIRDWKGKNSFRMKDLAKLSGEPRLGKAQRKFSVPVIINEYAWLWLNRKGMETCLTKNIYKLLLGPGSTVAQRRRLYARCLAALTEFWRCHRKAAGVLYFCGLGYSRPGDIPRPKGGATSDNFIDLQKLILEPYFKKYVRQSFNPVGIMLDFWAEELPPSVEHEFKVYVINDRYEDWKGDIKLKILRNKKEQSVKSTNCIVPALGQKILTFTQKLPAIPGSYTIIAELVDKNGETIRSLRDFRVF